MTKKREVIDASKLYFNKKFGEQIFIPGETDIPAACKAFYADVCADLTETSLDLWPGLGDQHSDYMANTIKEIPVEKGF